jgi:hypothetical protein
MLAGTLLLDSHRGRDEKAHSATMRYMIAKKHSIARKK